MDIIKKIIGFLLTALAGYLGFESAPEMTVNFTVVVAAVYAMTNFSKSYLPVKVFQIASWLIGIVFALLAYLLGYGIFADNIYLAIATGFLASLAANGVYDSQWIEAILNFIKSLFKK
jgi:hypothetical protein